MNHHQRLSPPGVNQALRVFLLLLLALTFQRALHAIPPTPSPRKTTGVVIVHPGYLFSIGAPALRFEEPAPPRNFAKISPDALRADTTLASAADNGSDDTVPPPAATSLEEANVLDPKSEKKAAPKSKALPILPDDLRPAAQPDDLVPFFQFPTSGNESGLKVIVPVPAAPGSPPALPVSSATYTQTPK